MYLLDTDHLSLLQRQGNSAQSLIQRLQLNMSPIAATVISYEEQTRGWMAQY
jgi:tRNA(fMet)-specific endonuclease VapC